MIDNPCRNSDIQRKEKVSERPTHPMTSLGEKEKALVTHLLNVKNNRFNIRSYSRSSGVPRATIYDLLEKLRLKDIVIKNAFGDFRLSEKGEEIARWVCRNSPQGVSEGMSELSTHYLKYKVKIEEETPSFKSRVTELNPIEKRELNLPNNPTTYLYFHDATIIIHKKQFIIRIHNIRDNDAEIANLEAFNKAISYVKKLNDVGLKGEKIELEQAHWARVNSVLADVLKKIDEHYYVDLGEGRKFWVDWSKGKIPEDETNDLDFRQKLDTLMKDVANSEHSFSDIDKIIQALGMVAKIETSRLVVNTMPQKMQKSVLDYVG